MTFGEWCYKYGVNSDKLIKSSGFASGGSKHWYKGRTYTELPFLIRQSVRLMSGNFQKFRQMEDFNFEFVSLMRKSCVCITSERIYPRYLDCSKPTYWNKLQTDDDFCKRICLDLHTGVMLFVGDFEY
jgi:hypothetical protein